MTQQQKWNLGFSTVALALLLIGLWQAYAPYAGRLQDIKAIRGSIMNITPEALAEKLSKSPHPTTVLYIYASWCGNCAVVTSHLASILREHEYDDMLFAFVSVDKDVPALLDYLIRNRYDGLFTPYIIHESTRLPKTVATLGGHYTGSIPYLAFFDRQGNMAAELLGAVDHSAILSGLKQARR